MGTGLRLALVAVLILANGYFVAVEFSLVAADRGRIETEAASGRRRARLAAGVMSQLSFHLSGAQLGITVNSLLLGFLAEPAVSAVLEPILEPVFGDSTQGVSLALALVLATVLQMIVGELIPKSIALARAHGTVLLMAPFVRVYGVVAGPLVRALNGLANATLRRFGIEPREELATTRNLDELMVVISAAANEGELDTEERQLLERSIRFGEKTAADIIVPRRAVEALHDRNTVADLVAATARTGFSRFPVMGRNLDDIVGTVHVRRVFEVDPSARERTAVATLMEDAFVVPESRDLDHLLVEMAGSGRQLAIVVDEYGGTAGILTVEDVVECIVGAIDDEHDHSRDPEVVRRGGRFEIAGSIHVDEMADACGLTLPEGDYETLAGFLLDRFGHIPTVGEAVSYQGWGLEVAQLDRLRISQVVVTPPLARDPRTDAVGTVTPLFLGVVLLALNAFFVATEFATIAARQTKLETMAGAGSRRALVALGATKQIQLQLAGAQLGITMASLGLGSVFEPFVDRHLGRAAEAIPGLPEHVATPVAFALSLLFVVFLHMVIGELVPKNLAISAPEATLLRVALPYRAYLAVFRPALVVLTAIAGAGVRLFGIQPRSELPRAHSPSDIAAMLDASKEEGLIEEFAHGLLAGVLDLRDRTAAEVMVPWGAAVVVPAGASVAEVERLAASVGHSRLPLAAASGPPTRFIHIKDLLQVPIERRDGPVPAALARTLLVCAPGDPLDGLLRSMRRSRVHVGVVVAPNDGAVGLVTLEDVLEELVGEIHDESDQLPATSRPGPGPLGIAAASAPASETSER